jgi:hypothetical protein
MLQNGGVDSVCLVEHTRSFGILVHLEEILVLDEFVMTFGVALRTRFYGCHLNNDVSRTIFLTSLHIFGV